MTRHWRMLLAGWAVADGLYWVALKPRLRRALGWQMRSSPAR
jgi:hypothetical protein